MNQILLGILIGAGGVGGLVGTKELLTEYPGTKKYHVHAMNVSQSQLEDGGMSVTVQAFASGVVDLKDGGKGVADVGEVPCVFTSGQLTSMKTLLTACTPATSTK